MKKFAANDPGRELALRLRYACEAHDATIGSHLDRVSRYACEIGRLVGLSNQRLEELNLATPLHDLGKIGISLELLNKPGVLTAAEMNLVKQHTVIGHRMLDGSPWRLIRCAASIALCHHESWDGSGYPNRLCRDQIPLEARIVAVADVYDALASRRSYKPAWVEDRVITEMRQMRGVKFDPEILDVFLARLSRITQPPEVVLGEWI